MLVRRQFVIERNEYTTAKEDGVCRDQPFRLICHDDAGAVTGGESGFLQSLGQRERAPLELAISQTFFLALAVGLDQTHFFRKPIQRISQRFADGLVFGKVQHYRRDWIRSASVLKSLT